MRNDENGTMPSGRSGRVAAAAAKAWRVVRKAWHVADDPAKWHINRQAPEIIIARSSRIIEKRNLSVYDIGETEAWPKLVYKCEMSRAPPVSHARHAACCGDK